MRQIQTTEDNAEASQGLCEAIESAVQEAQSPDTQTSQIIEELLSEAMSYGTEEFRRGFSSGLNELILKTF